MKNTKLKIMRGQAMLLTVMLLSMSMLGATALVGLLMTYQIRASIDMVSSTQAIFAADAGIECALYQNNKDENQFCGEEGNPVTLSNGATYRVSIERIGLLDIAKSVGQSRRTARSFQIPL